MDGILIRNDKIKDKFFVITDTYYFRGQNMVNENINNKLINITSYLDNNLKTDKNNSINLTVNKLYELSDINKLINDKKEYFNTVISHTFNGDGCCTCGEEH
jgi:hypothetical protein